MISIQVGYELSHTYSILREFFSEKWKKNYTKKLGWINSPAQNTNPYIIFPRYSHKLYENFSQKHTIEKLDLFIIEHIVFEFASFKDNEINEYLEIRFYNTAHDLEKGKDGLGVWESSKTAKHFEESIYIIHFPTKKIFKINSTHATARYRNLPNISELKRLKLIK